MSKIGEHCYFKTYCKATAITLCDTGARDRHKKSIEVNKNLRNKQHIVCLIDFHNQIY